MQIEAVLFDLFDTLVLLESGEVYYRPSLRKLYEFLTKNHIDVSFEDFERVYFEVRDKFYSESRKSLEEPHFNVRVSQTLKKLGYNYDTSSPLITGATMAFAEEFMHYVSLDTEAPDVLQKLHGKYKLGLVSNFAIPECGWKLLDRFGLRHFFDVVIISGEVNRRKPSPEIFEKALAILSLNASKAVFVGDMPDLDILGPKSVGMKTVLIKRRPIEDANIKPDKIITHLSELPNVLEDWR
jgi:HAD superfamily hydrolase (TIGR01509 family)